MGDNTVDTAFKIEGFTEEDLKTLVKIANTVVQRHSAEMKGLDVFRGVPIEIRNKYKEQLQTQINLCNNVLLAIYKYQTDQINSSNDESRHFYPDTNTIACKRTRIDITDTGIIEPVGAKL